MEHFGALEELALEAMRHSDTTSKEVYLTQLRKTALIDWAECVNLFDEAEKFELSPQLANIPYSICQNIRSTGWSKHY